LEDITRCITEKGILPETAFRLVTENPAKRLKQYPRKGTLTGGGDGDIVLLDQNYSIKMLFSMGKARIDRREGTTDG